MQDLPTFSATEVASHKERNDLWLTINGKVYNVTEYVKDHPGGADILINVAGRDATAEYQDVGHSEDADEILETYLVGIAPEASTAKRPRTIKLVQPASPAVPVTSNSSYLSILPAAAAGSLALAACIYGLSASSSPAKNLKIPTVKLSDLSGQQLLFSNTYNSFVIGFSAASVISLAAGSAIATQLSRFTQIQSGFTKFPPHRKQTRAVELVNPHMAKGFLDAKEHKPLELIRIDPLSPNVRKYVFKLPGSQDVVGLPIGQHVAIKATIDGKAVSRSYTPTSNNLDLGVLELVIKLYPDGLLTGKYFANLKVGDEVLFRGPKGAMRYHRGMCKKIGMIAGGTGITPMYQLIRAICEDEFDTTEVSLIFANQSEDDILLRHELEAFAARYPKNFKMWLMLDRPPANWAYGSGFVTASVMQEKLPAPGPETKIMLCGPPGMINASKKALGTLGFREPGPVGKMTDEIFLF